MESAIGRCYSSFVRSSDLAALRSRWTLANQRERRELRSLSMTEKAERLSALIRSASDFGWNRGFDDGDRVWKRWQRLRRAAKRLS